ncbi:hypothetical protein Pint_05577 [Pistacia integerrima]|uniref:Uncharacterized protein n=1 Tax=Pistacia integerrima TaxID=434235 RepID=A0ACC0Z7Z3_9ROSI|nr:hypothetical protein Pint_05577 [Pistacia integerrima]
MVLGMMIGAAGVGTHTAFKQLEHCPNVSASKKKRTSILEVEDPDFIINSAHRYTNKSVLRRVYRNLKQKRSTLSISYPHNPFYQVCNFLKLLY